MLVLSACSSLLELVPGKTASPTAAIQKIEPLDGEAQVQTAEPTDAEMGRLAAPPPGITYQIDRQIYQTTRSSEPERLGTDAAQKNAGTYSPDRGYLLLDEPNRQVVISQMDGSRSEIWPQEGKNLCRFSWVRGQPSVLLAVLLPAGISPDFSCSRGTPALYHSPSQKLEFLGEGDSAVGGIALSPDGHKIAYDLGGSPVLYDFDLVSEKIDLEDYGVEFAHTVILSDPAWSPSGRYLAWTFRDTLETQNQGVVLLDTKAKSAALFVPFTVDAYEAFRPEMIFNSPETHIVLRHYHPETGSFAAQLISIGAGESRQLVGFFNRWSPSGEYLLVENSPADGDRCRLQVESIDGSFIQPVCRGDQAFWSPDDMALLTFPYNREAFWLVDISTGQFQQVDLPHGAQILSWESRPEFK